MSASRTAKVCEGEGVNTTRERWQAGGLALLLCVAGLSGFAQGTNRPATASVPAPVASPPPRMESASSRRDDSAFRIISERNVFNASRSGGQVRLSTRRAARVESFTLVGTMAYEKGAFAFFNGTGSEFTKALKTGGVIAGHKLMEILADAVRLEADGKTLELRIGSTMRREDEGSWHPGDGVPGTASHSSASNQDHNSSDRADRSGRSDRGDYSSRSRRGESGPDRDHNNGSEAQTTSTPASSTSSANQSEILRRLMERREKESQ